MLKRHLRKRTYAELLRSFFCSFNDRLLVFFALQVQKEKDSYPVDRDRERLPVPKLSAAVVAPQVHIKEKKEKKKKKDRDKPRPTKVGRTRFNLRSNSVYAMSSFFFF